jgi:hypothetical protein
MWRTRLGDVPPIEDMADWLARGGAHQIRQGRIAIADDGDQTARLPALGQQRRRDGLRWLLGARWGQRETPRWSARRLDLADRHIDMAAAQTGHGAQMRSVDHDNNLRCLAPPTRRRCCGQRWCDGLDSFDHVRNPDAAGFARWCDWVASTAQRFRAIAPPRETSVGRPARHVGDRVPPCSGPAAPRPAAKTTCPPYRACRHTSTDGCAERQP